MSRISIYVLYVIMIATFIIGCNYNYDDKMLYTTTESPLETKKKETEYLENNCKLIIQGRDISSNCYVYMHLKEKYVELPLISILNELGASATRHSDKIVHFKYANKIYILDADKNSFYEKGKYGNLIALPPGTSHGICFTWIDKEYIVDSTSIRYLLNKLGFTMNIDYSQATVCINTIQ